MGIGGGKAGNIENGGKRKIMQENSGWGTKRPSQRAAEAKIIGWREDKDPGQLLAKVRTKVAQISGDEVGRAGFDGCQKDGDVFFRQVDATGQIARHGVKEFEVFRKPIEAVTLSIYGKVSAGFLQGIVPSAKHNIGQPPKPQKTGVRTIGGGEEDVGVEEEPVHRGGLLGRAVGNGVGIEAEAFDFAAGAAVVGNACGSGKQEFGLALR